MSTIQPKNSLEYIRTCLVQKDFMPLRKVIKDLENADLSDYFGELDLPECVVVYRLIPKDQRADVFSRINSTRQLELIEELPDIVVATLLNALDPDDRTALLEGLAPELRDAFLALLNPEERRISNLLLAYPEDSVGRFMNPEFCMLSPDMEISEAIASLRWNSVASSEQVHILYVVDGHGGLVGEVTLAQLVVCDPPTIKVQELMSRNTSVLNAFDDREAAVDAFRKYDKTIIPVVDDEKHILGVVTADDVFDVAEEEATEDIQQFGGGGALEDSYFDTPWYVLFRKRAGWLCVLFLGMMLTGSVLRHYNEALEEFGYLVFFLPLVIASGGNSGTQAASLIIRGIALNEVTPNKWFVVLRREVVMGVLLGAVLAALGFGRSAGWGYGSYIGLSVAITLVGVVTFGAVVGSMLPLFFKRLGLDPAVVSSPFISTLVDLAGITIFINVAVALLT